MKIHIPPSRIVLNFEPPPCLIGGLMKAEEPLPALSGGSTSKFLLTNAEGDALMFNGKPRVYEAAKPAAAAMKAFYALARIHKHTTKEPLSQPIIYQAISQNVHALDLDKKTKEEYLEKVKEARLGFSALIYLRKPSENKVRIYLVAYLPVLKPNKHEVQKGITKVAHAQIWKTRIPDDAVYAHKVYKLIN